MGKWVNLEKLVAETRQLSISDKMYVLDGILANKCLSPVQTFFSLQSVIDPDRFLAFLQKREKSKAT